MSSLADEIRVQAGVARGVATKLSTSASSTRTTITTMHWTSTAADHCRRVLTNFTHRMDGRSDDANTLAADIDAHANSVQSHLDTLGDLASLPSKAVDAVTGPPIETRPMNTDVIRGGAAR